MPNDGANFGYCSLAVGKTPKPEDELVMRWVSAVYLKVATLQQTVISVLQVKHSLRTRIMTYMVMMVLRAASRAHGFVSQAYGNFAFAYGSMLAAYNGAQVIGKGINEGSPLAISKRGLGLGYNVDIPTIFCQEGSGTNGAHAPIGFNTDSPRNKYHFALKVAIHSTM